MNNNFSPLFWLIVIAVAIAMLSQAFVGPSSGPVSTPSDNSFERRYVTERFRQEGYSAQDSATAADAVLKFQRAQEARKNR